MPGLPRTVCLNRGWPVLCHHCTLGEERQLDPGSLRHAADYPQETYEGILVK